MNCVVIVAFEREWSTYLKLESEEIKLDGEKSLLKSSQVLFRKWNTKESLRKRSYRMRK
jgi:hypothetical protein